MLKLLLIVLLCLQLKVLALSAAEPAVTPSTPALPSAAPSGGPESAWLGSFPPEQRRLLAGTPGRAVILWQPWLQWRGDVLMLPGPGNAVHQQGPLLALAERLAQSGWRVALLARDSRLEVSHAALPNADELAAVLALLGAEPAPANAPPAAPEGERRRFLLAQADAGELAWTAASSSDARFAGSIMLSTGALPDALVQQPPQQPLLELHIAEQARAVPAAAKARQARWQTLPQYQQQHLLTSARVPVLPWLSNAVDGWLRKIVATTATASSTDDSLKRQMTAQPGSTR